MGAVSVSWHADSSLQDYSTISVYVAEHDAGQSNFDAASSAPNPPRAQPWHVALRLVRDVEGPTMRAKLQQQQRGGGHSTISRTKGSAPSDMANGNNAPSGGGSSSMKQDDTTTPAMRVPMHDGEAYHMIGAFNHHHQHAVLQGSGAVRYSSTHRVALEEGHTYESIRARCLRAIEVDESIAGLGEKAASVWQEEQLCLSELEFEWLRQWYIQGSGHASALEWWHDKIADLEALWLCLERITYERMDLLLSYAQPLEDGTPRGEKGVDYGSLVELCVVLKGALSRRQRLRSAWSTRERDPIFNTLDSGYRPLPCLHAGRNAPSPSEALPAELSRAVTEVARLEKLFSFANKAQKPCKLLIKFGACSQGSACPFAHDGIATTIETPPKAQQQQCTMVVNDDEAARREWPWADSSFGDHYETPKDAYRHVKPLLKLAAKSKGMDAERLRIYDPYYCRGKVTSCLEDLGFPTVIHEKRDFYADIASSSVPVHDVLLTNPPYSGEHKERLFRYLLDTQKGQAAPLPFLLLLPAWSASKLAWRQLLWCLAALKSGKHDHVRFEDAAHGERAHRVGAFSDKLEETAGVMYVVPNDRYQFVPAVASRDEPPFDGIWFCGGFASVDACVKAVEKASAKALSKGEKTTEKEEEPPVRTFTSLAAMRSAGLLPSADEALNELSEAEREQRKRNLAALDEARNSDPHRAEKKRQKQLEQRSDTRYEGELTESQKGLVLQTPNACKHYFLPPNGSKGCTRGASCRFLHRIEGVNE